MSNDAADLLEFIRTNQSSENRVCEYKKGMSWDDKYNKEFKYKIVRAILAMSNLPDGGYVIIGVEKDGNENYVPTGMTEAEAGTYEYDKVLETFISMYSNEKYLGNRLAEEIGSIYDISHLEKSLSFEISFIYYLTIRSTLFYDRFTSYYSKQLFTKIIKSDEEIRKFIQERLARIQNYYEEVQRTMEKINQ